MLKNIKSLFIRKIIVSFLDEGLKLHLFKYNKYFQNNFNINIDNYMYFKGKYIKYESKKFGREYDYEDNLVFEGEYLNSRRNGKGKEYYNYNDKLLFEGEYLKGRRKGKGKEYYDNGDLKFEGQYLNGERYGSGKEYYYNDKLKFEGEYLNGERNGKGKEYYQNAKLKFEGEYFCGRGLLGTKYNIDGKIMPISK